MNMVILIFTLIIIFSALATWISYIWEDFDKGKLKDLGSGWYNPIPELKDWLKSKQIHLGSGIYKPISDLSLYDLFFSRSDLTTVINFTLFLFLFLGLPFISMIMDGVPASEYEPSSHPVSWKWPDFEWPGAAARREKKQQAEAERNRKSEEEIFLRDKGHLVEHTYKFTGSDGYTSNSYSLGNKNYNFKNGKLDYTSESY